MPTAPNPCVFAALCGYGNCAGQYYDYINTTSIPVANSTLVCSCPRDSGCVRVNFYFKCNGGYVYNPGARTCDLIPVALDKAFINGGFYFVFP